MKRRGRGSLLRVAVFALAAAIGGCGGSREQAPVPPAAEEQRNASRAGVEAFARGRHRQAARRFRKALALASLRDDAPAVVEARYNLAAALAEEGSHDEARALLDAARGEARREGIPAAPDLSLLESAIRYRMGDAAAAGTAARAARDGSQPASAVAMRATFLLGLIAADAGDTAALASDLADLGDPQGPRLQADRFELMGRLAGMRGDIAGAITALDEAARLRSRSGEHRGSARALATAAAIAAGAGLSAEAARYYLRAGRVDAERGDATAAREWLGRAATLASVAGDPQTRVEAEAALTALAPR